MKLTWLGQTGLAIETNGSLLMVDPYLMDTLSTSSGPKFNRMVPVDESWLQKKPDIILMTHAHGDHLDIPSLHAVIDTEKQVQILAGDNAWKKLRGQFPGTHNYIQMRPGTEWTAEEFHIRAIPACHSDDTALGYLIHAEGKTICISGDTLYQKQIIAAVAEPVDILFVVMNGLGNNMNYRDAARYAADLGAKVSIPVHWGLFEKFSADPALFTHEADRMGINTYVAQIYEELDIDALLEDKN